MENKKKYLLFLVLILIIIISLGTYAWLSWRSNDTAMVLTIGDIDNVRVTLKPYQIDAEISPVLTYSSEDYVNVEAVNNGPINKKVILYYQINNIDTSLVNSNFKYTITKSTNNGSTYTEYKTGNFAGAVAGNTLEIMNEEVPKNNTYLYKVYVWLDGSNTGQGNIQGATFNGELRAEIKTNQMKSDIGASNDTDDVFDSGILRSSIETVTFQNTIPNNITSSDQPIDVSVAEDNSVIAYFKPGTTSGKYHMYIAANGMIIASSLEKFFNFYTNLISIENISYLDTSQSTSMKAMFQNCNSLTSLDVSSFDTSNVTNMANMFMMAINLTSLDLSNFDTSKVTSMQGMFAGHKSVGNMKLTTIIGIEDFNTSNVTDMLGVFQKCTALTGLDLSKWDTSKVTTMKNMFRETNLTTLDVSNFNTSKVTDMSYMFHTSSNLTSLDLSSFNTSNVTNMRFMFYNCSKLTTLDVSSFDTSKVTNMEYLFAETKISSLEMLENWNTSSVTTMGSMFRGCSNITTLSGLENWNVSNVINFSEGYDVDNSHTQGMFENCTSLTDASAINNWNVLPTAYFNYMFKNANNKHPEFTKVSGTWSNGTFIVS